MKQTDEELIEQIKRRDEKAFEYIVKIYGRLIKSIVSKHMYNLESYQDECINDILLAIWDNVECYDEAKNSFKNWIAVISKYTSLNYVKKYKKYSNNIELDEFKLVTEDTNINQFIQEDISKELEKMLSCLKKKDRVIFTELYLKDKSIEEICFQTGMRKDYIYNRLSRGKKKLRTLWNKGGTYNESKNISFIK